VDELESTTQWLQQSFKTSPDDAGFGAVDFLRAFALTYLGYNWLRMAKAACSSGDEGFKRGKLATAQFFAARMLPQVHQLCANVRSPAGELMQLDPALI
jgi:hypothetical protein